MMFHVEQFYLQYCIIGRMFVACPRTRPEKRRAPDTCLSVCFTLDCVQFSQTDCAFCPFQSRQRQQNISLLCAHKADLSFAQIPNCSGLVFIELNGVQSERNNYLIIVSPHHHTTFPIPMRAISLQKVHLWMDISADCPNRGRRSLTKMDRLRNVQSSAWTLQQILSDKLPVLYT